MRFHLFIGIAYCLLFSCTDTDIEYERAVLGSEESFGTLVQPYVVLGCGSLDCHGDSGRMFRLYGEHGLRLNDNLRGLQTSEEETMENLRSFAGVSHDVPLVENLILRKALSIEDGGYEHLGGAVWTDINAPGYRCLLGWLSEKPALQFSDACVEALETVRLEDI